MTDSVLADTRASAGPVPSTEPRSARPTNGAGTSDRNTRRDLCSSATDGAGFSLMVGLTETYFAALFVTVGLSDFAVGVMVTLPYLLGSLLQLTTPWGVQRLRSFRRWVVWNAGLQGLSLVGLAAAVHWGWVQFPALLVLVSLYFAAGLATAPVWNTWIEKLIPRSVRAQFLSRRMRICQFCLMVGIVIAGYVLWLATSHAVRLHVFTALLLAGGVARFVSAWMLHRQSERPHWLAGLTTAPALTEDDRAGLAASRRVIPYCAAMQLAIFCAGPYFTPFMLRVMELPYWQFTLLIMLGYLGRIVTLAWAGNVARYFGQATLLWIGGVGIIPASGLWIFYESFWFLCVLQFVAGAAWACYELGMMLVFVERIPQARRVVMLSWYNAINGIGMVLGSLLGGWIIWSWSGVVAGFLIVFVLSTGLRLAALVLFPFALLRGVGQGNGPLYMFYPAPDPNSRTLLRPFYAFGDNPGNRVPQDDAGPA